jgi:hypothetical protein
MKLAKLKQSHATSTQARVCRSMKRVSRALAQSELENELADLREYVIPPEHTAECYANYTNGCFNLVPTSATRASDHAPTVMTKREAMMHSQHEYNQWLATMQWIGMPPANSRQQQRAHRRETSAIKDCFGDTPWISREDTWTRAAGI